MGRHAAAEKESVRRECSEEVQRIEAKNDEIERELADARKELAAQAAETEAQKQVRNKTLSLALRVLGLVNIA